MYEKMIGKGASASEAHGIHHTALVFTQSLARRRRDRRLRSRPPLGVNSEPGGSSCSILSGRQGSWVRPHRSWVRAGSSRRPRSTASAPSLDGRLWSRQLCSSIAASRWLVVKILREETPHGRHRHPRCGTLRHQLRGAPMGPAGRCPALKVCV